MLDEELNISTDSEENKEDLLKNIDTSMFSSEQLEQQENIVEAILFMMGDSVSVDVLATALSKDHDIALAAVERLVKKYNTIYCDRGMKVIRINHKYQMVANNQYFQNLVLVASKPQKPVLTEAVLETLSIIAYKQPITKPEIENIRGVKSDFAVNRLIEYGLIEEKGRLEAPGRPILLGTTEEFLLRFGLESTDDLPILPMTREEEIKDEVAKELQKAFGEHIDVNVENRELENVDDNFDDKNDDVDNNNQEDNFKENIIQEDINIINNNENDSIEQNNSELSNQEFNHNEDIIVDDNDYDDNNNLNDDTFNKNNESNGVVYDDKLIIENTQTDFDINNNENIIDDDYTTNQNNEIYKQEEIEKTDEIDIVDYEDNNILNDLYNKNIDYVNNNNTTNQHFDSHIDTQKDENVDGDDKEPQ